MTPLDWMVLLFWAACGLLLVAAADAVCLAVWWGWERWRARGRCVCGSLRVAPGVSRWHPSGQVVHSRVLCAPMREMVP